MFKLVVFVALIAACSAGLIGGLGIGGLDGGIGIGLGRAVISGTSHQNNNLLAIHPVPVIAPVKAIGGIGLGGIGLGGIGLGGI